MKKVPARIQNAGTRAAAAKVLNGRPQLARGAGAAGAAAGSAPYAASCIWAGLSRMNSSTSTSTMADAATTGSKAQRQPYCAISQAAAGKNSSWPVALLPASNPMTRPLRCTNQRLATVAPSTMAVRPVPRPSTMPQSTKAWPRLCMNRPSSKAPAITAAASATTRDTP
jgi:hypothetical protein